MMDQVPRTQKLWRVPYFQLLILFLECWVFVTKTKGIREEREREKKEKKEKKILPKGFPFLCCYGLNRGGVSKSLP
jgi:cytochrome c-type biogenesis protein CcmH/NrfF